MKVLSCVLLMPLLLSIGCSTSYEVTSSADADPSLKSFNVEANDRIARIVFLDRSELDARNIIASADSTRFQKDTTDAITVVPTHTIKKVIFTDHGVGFLEGFGWGAGIGVVTFATLALVNGEGFAGADLLSTTLFFAAVGGAGGGVVGGIIGVSVGHSYEYQFVTSANSTTIK
jgi:hypothetical protein